MIDYTSVEGKASLECYTLEDFLQETLELGAKGYKLCLENDYFCFNRGGNYTAYFDAPAADSTQVSEQLINLSTTDATAFLAALGFEEEDTLLALSTPEELAAVAASITERENETDASEAGSKEGSLYDQLVEGMEALQADREGSISLPRTQPVSPELDATPTDVNDAVTPPATDATPTPRRGRPPRNAT